MICGPLFTLSSHWRATFLKDIGFCMNDRNYIRGKPQIFPDIHCFLHSNSLAELTQPNPNMFVLTAHCAFILNNFLLFKEPILTLHATTNKSSLIRDPCCRVSKHGSGSAKSEIFSTHLWMLSPASRFFCVMYHVYNFFHSYTFLYI